MSPPASCSRAPAGAPFVRSFPSAPARPRLSRRAGADDAFLRAVGLLGPRSTATSAAPRLATLAPAAGAARASSTRSSTSHFLGGGERRGIESRPERGRCVQVRDERPRRQEPLDADEVQRVRRRRRPRRGALGAAPSARTATARRCAASRARPRRLCRAGAAIAAALPHAARAFDLRRTPPRGGAPRRRGARGCRGSRASRGSAACSSSSTCPAR